VTLSDLLHERAEGSRGPPSDDGGAEEAGAEEAGAEEAGAGDAGAGEAGAGDAGAGDAGDAAAPRAHALPGTLTDLAGAARPSRFSGLDPAAVLRVVPDDRPLQELLPFLERAVPQRLHDIRRAQVRKNLWKYTAQVSAPADLCALQGRKVVLDRDTRCCISGEPVDENMVFAVFPNGRVCLHHHLHGKDLSVDPVTGDRFGSPVVPDAWLPGPSGTEG
jgi:hypothetical protein